MTPKSTRKTGRGKAAKPRPDFPLFPHATGRWAKKVHQKLHYFGSTADDPKGQAALEQWLEQKDDILAGRTPRAKAAGLTVADLCNHFLTAKRHLTQTGEIGTRTFADYYAVAQNVVGTFGKTRLVIDLAADDFDRLRRQVARTNGPVGIGNQVRRVRTIFRYGHEDAGGRRHPPDSGHGAYANEGDGVAGGQLRIRQQRHPSIAHDCPGRERRLGQLPAS